MINHHHEIETRIAEALLEIGAITLSPKEPFTWTSGMKSPIYCDNRITISYPEVRRLIASAFAELISEKFPDAELIAGTSTGGIAHAAWVADLMDLPMVYVRGKAKGHGKQNLVEGLLKRDQKTVVIEDLISTGGSVLQAAEAVEAEGGKVEGIAAIFTYELEAGLENFKKHGFPLICLSNYTTLIQCAAASQKIDEQELSLLQKWKEDPYSYG